MPRKRKPRIVLTRGSVCAADDLHAPHRREWIPSKFTDLDDLLVEIRNSYLPRNIQGGKATWVGRFKGVPIGVIAQQQDTPTPIASDSLVDEILKGDRDVEVHWVCLGSEDPEKVIRELTTKMNPEQTRAG